MSRALSCVAATGLPRRHATLRTTGSRRSSVGTFRSRFADASVPEGEQRPAPSQASAWSWSSTGLEEDDGRVAEEPLASLLRYFTALKDSAGRTGSAGSWRAYPNIRETAATAAHTNAKRSPRRTYGVSLVRPATLVLRTPVAPGRSESTTRPYGSITAEVPVVAARTRYRRVSTARKTAMARCCRPANS